LNYPTDDDIPFSEAILIKPTELKCEQKKTSSHDKTMITVAETLRAKEVVVRPVASKPLVETKPIPDQSAAVTSVVVKPDKIKSDEKKQSDEFVNSAIAKPVAEKMDVVKSNETRPVSLKPVVTEPVVSAKLPAVKRVVIKSVAKKSVSAQSVASKTAQVEPSVESSTAPVDSARVKSASNVAVSRSALPLTNPSAPIKSTPVQAESHAIKTIESIPVKTSVVPVIDLTDPKDKVKQEIDDPEFDSARVADRRKSLNELIDLCSDTSSEPPNRSPTSSTSCKRYKAYDNIDEQLEADMEREQQYFDGVDEAHDRNLWNPLDVEELPSSKFKLSRRKRTRIWILSLDIETETVWDEVDVYIETQKRRDRTRSRFFSV